MTRLADGSFIIDSMSGASRAYRVDVEAGTCSCRHFVQRLSGSGQKCKHLLAVEAELQPPTALQRMTERAEKLSDEELLKWAKAKDGPAACACWLELARRRAEQPEAGTTSIPAGVLELLEGATDAERERALAVYK